MGAKNSSLYVFITTFYASIVQAQVKSFTSHVATASFLLLLLLLLLFLCGFFLVCAFISSQLLSTMLHAPNSTSENTHSLLFVCFQIPVVWRGLCDLCMVLLPVQSYLQFWDLATEKSVTKVQAIQEQKPFISCSSLVQGPKERVWLFYAELTQGCSSFQRERDLAAAWTWSKSINFYHSCTGNKSQHLIHNPWASDFCHKISFVSQVLYAWEGGCIWPL